MRYRFGGLIFGGAYTWRGLSSEFYGISKSYTTTYNTIHSHVIFIIPFDDALGIINRHYINLNNICKVVSCQRVSVKRVNPPSLPFPDLIRTRIPLSCSSAGISSHTLRRNVKLEKEIMNY